MKREVIFNTAFGVKTKLVDLESNQCAWGIGDPQHADFAFCGAIKTTGSYCDMHNSIAYTEKSDRRKEGL